MQLQVAAIAGFLAFAVTLRSTLQQIWQPATGRFWDLAMRLSA
jgi:hypothetical protein